MMELSSSLSVSASIHRTSGHQEPTTEEAEIGIAAACSRKAARRLGRERLLSYVQDIIRRQRKPLHEIVRDHALPFLPVQSLLRFRAVSTTWNRHICSPFFAHTQSHAHRSPSGLLFTSHTHPHGHYLPFDPASGAVFDPSFGFLPEPVEVRASARGLVCCSTVGGPYRRTRYYVCNPATGRWTKIQGSAIYGDHAVALLFRPSPLNFSADFDLVCVVQSNKKIAFEVFSSRMGRWRLSEEAVSGGERPLQPRRLRGRRSVLGNCRRRGALVGPGRGLLPDGAAAREHGAPGLAVAAGGGGREAVLLLLRAPYDHLRGKEDHGGRCVRAGGRRKGYVEEDEEAGGGGRGGVAVDVGGWRRRGALLRGREGGGLQLGEWAGEAAAGLAAQRRNRQVPADAAVRQQPGTLELKQLQRPRAATHRRRPPLWPIKLHAHASFARLRVKKSHEFSFFLFNVKKSRLLFNIVL